MQRIRGAASVCQEDFDKKCKGCGDLSPELAPHVKLNSTILCFVIEAISSQGVTLFRPAICTHQRMMILRTCRYRL